MIVICINANGSRPYVNFELKVLTCGSGKGIRNTKRTSFWFQKIKKKNNIVFKGVKGKKCDGPEQK